VISQILLFMNLLMPGNLFFILADLLVGILNKLSSISSYSVGMCENFGELSLESTELI
jgi:hypothetical protein